MLHPSHLQFESPSPLLFQKKNGIQVLIILHFQILGDGDLTVKLNIKAHAFSASAKAKLEAVGSTITVLPGRKKWVKPSVAKNLARADEYFAKKRAAAAAAAASDPLSS